MTDPGAVWRTAETIPLFTWNWYDLDECVIPNYSQVLSPNTLLWLRFSWCLPWRSLCCAIYLNKVIKGLMKQWCQNIMWLKQQPYFNQNFLKERESWWWITHSRVWIFPWRKPALLGQALLFRLLYYWQVAFKNNLSLVCWAPAQFCSSCLFVICL